MPKKTKAIKKTDSTKPWLKKVKPSAYKIDTKEVYPIILIVCEGQTEKLYFDSFPVLTLTIEVIDLQGQSKLKLIEATESIINSRNTQYDQVWCVFDLDERQVEKDYASFDNAIKSGLNKGYQVAYSNDCFELWFYLHYCYTDEKNYRNFYYKQLGEKWNCQYKKVGKQYKFSQKIYSILDNDKQASQIEAIRRAKALHHNQENNPFHQQNPVTLVYILVEILNKNLRK